MSRKTAVHITIDAVLVLLVALLLVLPGTSACRPAPPPADDQAAPAAASAPAVPAPTGETAPVETGGVAMTTGLFRSIARQENPIVVSITTETKVATQGLGDLFDNNDFFRRFFGVPPVPQEQIQRALGSGFLISGTGEILTNNHVVAGAQQIKVGLFADDRKTYDAKVVGRDPLTDSALIRLVDPPPNLPVAKLGNSDALEPGDWVMAIGNPFQLGHTVTVGVISYNGRPFTTVEGRSENMLQTDAAINPGNSGGPLINVRGEVIGINAAILAGQDGGGNIGIGFAVPINTVKALLPQLQKGKVQRGRLGVQIRTAPVTEAEAKSLGLPRAEGVIVVTVEHDSPAAQAGIRAGDVSVEYGGKPVQNGDQMVALVTSTPPGTRVPIKLIRNGKELTVTVTVTELNLEGQGQESSGPVAAAGLGLSLRNLTPDTAQQLSLPPGTGGALVSSVQPGSTAADAGIQAGDVIVEVNRRPVHTADGAARELARTRPGDVVFLLIWRQGNEIFLSLQR
jgi:serine protease Do